jgi:hypothetical protein
MKTWRFLIALAVIGAGRYRVNCQTRIGLSTQGKTVDFSAAPSTKPFKVGSTLPATCSIGAAFFLTSAPAGKNLYLCTATDTWTLQSSAAVLTVFGRIGTVASQTGDFTASQITNAVDKTAANIYTAGAKQTFTPGATLTGLRVAPSTLPSAPQTGDLAIDASDSNKLKFYNGTAWMTTVAPPDLITSIFGRTGAVTAQAGDYLVSQITNAVDKTAATAYTSGAKQTFTPSASQPGLRVIPAVLPTAPQSGDLAIDAGDVNKLKYFDGTSWIATAGAAGGGNITSIFGRTGTVTAQSGDYLAAQVTNAADKTAANIFSAGARQTFTAGATLPGLRIVPSTLPSSPASGDLAIDSADSNKLKVFDGSSWVITAAAPASVGSVFGRTGTVTAQAGDYLASQVTNGVDKTAATIFSAGARQTFTASASNPGLRVAPAALPNTPQSGDMAVDSGDGNSLKFYNGTAWVPAGTGKNYGLDFVSQTSIVMAAAAHGFATANLVVACYDAATPAKQIEPDTVTVHPTTFDVTVNFTTAQTGHCVVNGSGGSGGGGSGGGGSVLSVFGRTGTILKQFADYAFSDISGSATLSQLPSGIDATKIGSGTVDSTHFAFLQSVSSDIQTQLNLKSPSSHSHFAAGDVTGDLSSNTVTALQNRPVSAVAPGSGQVLGWNAGSSQWEPQTGSGGGGAATMGAQLGDFGVVRTTSLTLQIGVGCSNTTPCNVRLGSTTFSFTQGSTLTVGGTTLGAGTVFIYIARSGALTAGHNFPAGDTLSCGNCTVQAAVPAFPLDSIPLYTWTATWPVGSPVRFDVGGGIDQRATYSAGKAIAPGVGLIAADLGATTNLALDTSLVGLRVGVPATAVTACDSGSWAADGSFLYICFQANGWRRVAIASW